jgi:spermidine synthase
MTLSSLRRFVPAPLHVIVAVSGAVVMVMELAGSRLVAPYLGTSLVVWSSLIGIILGALSAGYAIGGRLSAHNPRLPVLGAVLLLAAIAIAIIAAVNVPVLYYVAKLGVTLGALVGVSVLFVVPSVLLGIISPYAVRLATTTVEGAGATAGNLYALSTLGSIAGTFAAGFWLIPNFGTTNILYGLSVTLVLCALLAGTRSRVRLVMILLGAAFVAQQGFASAAVFEGDTAYNHIRVVDGTDPETQRPIRVLYMATEAHSIIYRDGTDLFSSYERLYRLDQLFAPTIRTALTIGGGGYVGPNDFLDRFPEATMTVVEIDPGVTQVAKTYFNLADDPRLSIVHADGRIFLNRDTAMYDVIYGDAFGSYFSIPFQLATREAMQRIHDRLNPDGVLLLNVIASLQGEKSLVLQAEVATLREVFDQVYLFPAHYTDPVDLGKAQNIMVVATKNPTRISKEELLKRANANVRPDVERLWEGEIGNGQDIPVLTDNFAPVDYYVSKLL